MARTGRPKIIIDDLKLMTVCGYKIPLIDVATIFGCSGDTIERHIKKHHGLTFAEFRKKHMATTRSKLVNKAIDMALHGNTAMMIFTLKNLCGWKDKHEVSNEADNSFKLSYSLDDK